MEYALRVIDGDAPLLPLLDDEIEQSGRRVDATVADALTRLDQLKLDLNDLGLEGHKLTDDIDSIQPNPLLESKLGYLDHLKSIRNYVLVIRNILVLVDQVVDEQSYKPLLTQIDTCIAELPSLREFLLYSQQKAFNKLKGIYESEVSTALEGISYPYTQDPPAYNSFPQEARVKFELSFRALLKFIQTTSSTHSDYPWITMSPPSPMSCLVHPLQLRFKFHFDTERPTNRLDKPEWYFTHILNALHLHRAFITGPVQHLFSALPGQPLALSEFTNALLPVPTRKFRKSVASIIQPVDGSPPKLGLLAHTLQQALIFDAKIKEDAYLEDDEWKGVAWEVLGKPEWFDTWLKGETDFAQHQYNVLIHSHTAWVISSTNNSTTSASSLLTLLTRTTESVLTPLPPSHRIPFLINIHISLLKAYHQRIEGSLDAFDALSGILGVGASVVPGDVASLPRSGGGGGEMTKGTEGTSKLLKALLSSRAIKEAVRSWGVEMVFLEIQEHLIVEPVKNSWLPPADELGRGTAELFDRVVGVYEKLHQRSADMVVDVVVREVSGDLSEWFGEQWTYMSSTPPEQEEETSPLLHPPLRTLDAHLRYLSTPAPSVTLPSLLLSQLSRSIMQKISETIISKSAVLQCFTGRGRGKKATSRVANAWGKDISSFILLAKTGAGGEGVAGWKKLEEMAAIMELSASDVTELVDILFGAKEEKEWDAWREKLDLDVLSMDDVRRLLRCREESSKWT